MCYAKQTKFWSKTIKGCNVQNLCSNLSKKYFAKLAAPVDEGGDPTVPEEDKKKLRVLLKKPWNPYLVHRHTTLTERGEEGGLGDSPLFDQFAGWRFGSTMRRKYVHLKSKSSSRALLKQWGVKLETEEEGQQIANNRNAFKPISCPDCKEVNETGAKSCRNCGMILSYDYYKATTKESEETKRKLEQLETQHEERFKKLQEEVASLRETKFIAYLRLKEEAERGEVEEPVSNESDLVNFIPSKELEAQLCHQQQKKDNNPIY